jgi:hypothetical protein
VHAHPGGDPGHKVKANVPVVTHDDAEDGDRLHEVRKPADRVSAAPRPSARSPRAASRRAHRYCLP